MAEATLVISIRRVASEKSWTATRFAREALAEGRLVPDEHGQMLVSSGPPAQDVRVVDPITLAILPPGQVGEICIAGPSASQGYWGKPEINQKTIVLLADGTGRKYLRTGDLGSVIDGQVFVTGRHKDIIIIRGRNIYPQDIELTVERSHPLLRPNCCIAFGVGEPETLAVVAETREPMASAQEGREVTEAIRSAVVREHDLRVKDLLLLARNAVPKTPSGKVRRLLCKDMFVKGEFGAPLHGGASSPPTVPAQTVGNSGGVAETDGE